MTGYKIAKVGSKTVPNPEVDCADLRNSIVQI